jgi:hypothetical protein
MLSPLIASVDVKLEGGPGIPTHLLGTNSDTNDYYYFSRLYEPSNFVVDNNLEASLRKSVRNDLWMAYHESINFMRVVFGYSDIVFANHFISYADPASLHLYLNKGWITLKQAAELFGIKNKSSPDGEFPASPIFKDGVYWTPIYTNLALLLQNEDFAQSGKTESQISSNPWTPTFLRLLRNSNDPNKLDTNIKFPQSFLILLNAIKNNLPDSDQYWFELMSQLYFIAAIKDTIQKINSADLSHIDEKRLQSLKIFRAQSHILIDYYLKIKNELSEGLLKYLESVFTTNNTQLKIKTLKEFCSLFSEERFVPGLWKIIDLIDKEKLIFTLKNLPTHNEEPELSKLILYYIQRAEHLQ